MAAFREARTTPGLRLTPRQSPLYRTPTSRSPVKSPLREENCLSLKQVIGTTAASANGFDHLESQRCFAFIAGAAAVIAIVDDKLRITQRFFRARPSTAPNATTPLYDSPTPLASSYGPRTRLGASLRDSGATQPPFTTASDSSDTKGGAVRDRAKAATCVALSRDGRWIALGETGHRPRVLVFSTAKDAPTDIPVASISEHTFGVKCVAFSADSQYLASLGEVNDGFLFIWKINRTTGSASLHSSNKCTSYVRQIAWLGHSLVSVGVRHVKIWRPNDADESSRKSSPSKRYSDVSFAFSSPSRTLSGRNCLLGPLLDKAFTCIVPLSATQAIVCSEDGDVCVLDNSEATPRFTKAADCSICINAATRPSKHSLVVGGSDGEMKIYNIPTLLDQAEKQTSPMNSGSENAVKPFSTSAHILAMVPIGDNVLTLDSTRHMQILNLSLGPGSSVLSCSIAHRYPAHGAAVLGVQALNAISLEDAAFLTYSAEGSVLFWNAYGVCVRDMAIKIDQVPLTEEDPLPNELRVVRAFKGYQYLLTGDRLGIVKIIEYATGKCVFEARAHSTEITDFGVYENKKMCTIASAGRDRMAQVFRLQGGRPSACGLSQTLDEHVGAVTSISFSKDASKLISSSTDRTIVIRESITGELAGQETTAYVIVRTITLKATPLSVCLSSQKDDELLVATIDRHISRYDVLTGVQIATFKAADNDGGDSVIASSATYMPLGQKTGCVACVSSTDKSIRVYDDAGRVIGREYGHTEGMMGVAAISTVQENDKSSLVTVASDGTIFIWSATNPADQLADLFEKMEMKKATPTTNVFATLPPLRRVLSSQDLMSIQGRRDDDGSSPVLAARSRSKSPKRKVSRTSLVPTSGTALEPVTERRSLRRTQTSTVASAGSATTPNDSRKSPEISDSAGSTVVNGRVLRKTRSRGISPSSEMKRMSQTVRGVPARTSSVQTSRTRRKSVGAVAGSGEEVNSLTLSTEQICRALHAYRKKLGSSQEALAHESVKEFEKELSMTARALADKAKSETVMVKLLDQYSQRLLGMLDDKMRANVESKIRRESEVAGAEAEEALRKHMSKA